MINIKFILIATLTFIPYTVLWFFWHNNMMHSVYYTHESFYMLAGQNIWAMNFANALLVYGFVYFYFKSAKQDTKITQSILWGIYYNLSVIGFSCFILFGILKNGNVNILVHDLIWAVFGGVISGGLAHIFFNKIKIKP